MSARQSHSHSPLNPRRVLADIPGVFFLKGSHMDLADFQVTKVSPGTWRYRQHVITDAGYTARYSWVAEDYDGAPEGGGVGCADHRHGEARTLEEACEAIDESILEEGGDIEETGAPCERCGAQARTEEIPFHGFSLWLCEGCARAAYQHPDGDAV